MKFYGYQNTYMNRICNRKDGGEWVRVCFVRFLLLKLFGYMTKFERHAQETGLFVDDK